MVYAYVQDPEGMRELANSRIMYRLAKSRYLISHVQSEQHLGALISPHAGGPHSVGVLSKRFHLLLLPTLRLFVMLLHEVTEGRRITEPALEFLWSHRYLIRQLLRVGGGAGRDPYGKYGTSGRNGAGFLGQGGGAGVGLYPRRR